MTRNITLRDAGEADLPAILEIHNHAVRHETSIWNDDVADLGERRTCCLHGCRGGFQCLSPSSAGLLQGSGTFCVFPLHPGYRFTVEHSLYVAEQARRQGVGSALLTRLID